MQHPWVGAEAGGCMEKPICQGSPGGTLADPVTLAGNAIHTAAWLGALMSCSKYLQCIEPASVLLSIASGVNTLRGQLPLHLKDFPWRWPALLSSHPNTSACHCSLSGFLFLCHDQNYLDPGDGLAEVFLFVILRNYPGGFLGVKNFK